MPNEVMKAIMSRRSARAYKPDPLPAEVMAAIVEAGRVAPYVTPGSRHFSVIQDKGRISRLSAAAKSEGMKISDFHRELFSAPGFDGTYGAPVAVVLSGNETTVQYKAVCAASIQNMLIAAESFGVASCWVYFPIFAFHGKDCGAWREELCIPDGYKPCAAVLLGYGAESAVQTDGERYKNDVVYL